MSGGAAATQDALLTALSCCLVFGLLSAPLSKFLSNSVFAHLLLESPGRVQAIGE